jgi:hypothetical protein
MASIDIPKLFPYASSVGTMINADRSGEGDSAKAVEAATTAHRAWRNFREFRPLPPPSDALLLARKNVSRAWGRSAGIDSDVTAILDIERARRTKLRNATKLFDYPLPPITPRAVTNAGELWWAQTEWRIPQDRVGLYAYFDDSAGGVKFIGQLDYDDGDLWSSSVTATGTFALGTDRRPLLVASPRRPRR